MLLAKSYGNIAFLSTYPPRECGLATFTQDLITAIDNIGIIDTGVINRTAFTTLRLLLKSGKTSKRITLQPHIN